MGRQHRVRECIRALLGACLTWLFIAGIHPQIAAATAQPPPPEECGQQPVNVCIMLDRTGSVSSSERTNEATAAKHLVASIAALNNLTRVAIGRFGDANNGGVEAEIVKSITAINPGNLGTFNTSIDNALASGSSVGTDVKDAIVECKTHLLSNQNGEQNIIILISDFDPNEPGSNPDNAATAAANIAKNTGMRIFSIGFDVSGESAADETNRALGASIASGTATDNHCTASNCDHNGTDEIAAENADGDDWFLSPTANELNAVFDTIFQVLQCEDDGNPCTVEACNQQGLCGSSFIPDCRPCSEGCDDGNACNGTETCGANNTCQAGTNLSCNDGSLCTADSCNPNSGCVYSPKTCTDGLDCSVDSCNPSTGECNFDTGACECRIDADCNDGNACTDSACVQGECVNTNDNSNSCDDGLFCNGSEACDAGACKHAGDPCTTGSECANSCDEETNSCNDPAGGSCDDLDDNVCTSGECNGSGSCVASNNDMDCDDGNPCTLEDSCTAGSCGGTTKSCDDGVSCTPDSCNESTGACENPTSECECATDADCNDGNECTDEFCNAQKQCERSNNDDPCEDGLFCNGSDTCAEGSCGIHGDDPCAAGGECANDCDEETDSCNAPAGTSCTDDDNVCTTNECNGEGSCEAANNELSCDDGDPCTLDDTCSEGDCQAGTPKDCSDDRECAETSCNGDTGACEIDLGSCECQVDGDCNDGNVCTVDACNSGSNTCSNTVQQGAECDDGTLCTIDDQCDEGGACGGVTLDCADGDVCTEDSCNPEAGCVNEEISECGEPEPTPTATPTATPPPPVDPGDDSGQGGEGPVGGPTGGGGNTRVLEGSGCALYARSSQSSSLGSGVLLALGFSLVSVRLLQSRKARGGR